MAIGPVLECRGLANIEAGEKLAVIEGKRFFQRAPLCRALKLVRIDLERRIHPYAIALRLQPVVAQHLAQLVQLLVEGMAPALGIPLGPEKRRQGLARGFPFHGEIEQYGAAKALRRKVGELGAVAIATHGAEGEQAKGHPLMIGGKEVLARGPGGRVIEVGG